MTTTKNQTENETAIRELIARWAKAAVAKDIEGIMASHTPDMLAFDGVGPLQFKGADVYRKHWETFFPMSTGDSIFEPTELNVTAGDDVAFATCITRCGGSQADGATFECLARTTLGFRKIDGEWTFTHEHHSMPMPMDGCGSGKDEAKK